MNTTLFPTTALPPPCKHYLQAISFNGVTYFGSSHYVREPEEQKPDYGFYLDSVWKPDTIAIYTHWQDFGLPTLPIPEFVRLLKFVESLAKDHTMEVGCIGGHGRTGTALASLAVIAGLTPNEAIENVRTLYCEKAIETDRQEWVVEAVFCDLYALECPEPPPAPVYSTGGMKTSWGWEDARAEKDENAGKLGRINTDASGVEYCSLCLVDIPKDKPVTGCEWCGAKLTKGKV